MEVIHAGNVNDAYYQGLRLLRDAPIAPSRAGEVRVWPTPVTTVYERPTERVLFDPKRDANPFFHLFEALWMLSGRNDATWLDRFVKDFSSRFTEADGTQHGAYGHRWRNTFGFDQLHHVVETLRSDPTSRQCVIQMWDAYLPTRYSTNGGEADCGSDDLRGNWKDRPCNTHIYLRVNAGHLDMTVCCRSNDAIWGAYGANAVHFSVLQEYLAARIGVAVGRYYQISNNFHTYTAVYNKMVGDSRELSLCDWYDGKKIVPTLMVTDPENFDADLRTFNRWASNGSVTVSENEFYNPWFVDTAIPLFQTHELWISGERVFAMQHLYNSSSVHISPDWRLAAIYWMQRRLEKREKTA